MALLMFGITALYALQLYAEEQTLSEFERATRRVEDAIADVNADEDEDSVAQLKTSSAQLDRFGALLARDREARQLLRNARIIYARALLNQERRSQAAEEMDDIIRAALGAPLLDMRRFGPEIRELYEQRVDALDSRGRGSIQVQCYVSCEIVVEHTPVVDEPTSLYLGTYRVWVREQTLEGGAEPSTPPFEREIALAFDEQAERISFGVPQPSPTRTSRPPIDRADAQHLLDRMDQNVKRLRIGGITATSVGGASLLIYGIAHVTRDVTGNVLNNSGSTLSSRKEEQFINTYNDSGVVAFGGALTAGILVPAGIGMLVGAHLLERKHLRLRRFMSLGPAAVTLRF